MFWHQRQEMNAEGSCGGQTDCMQGKKFHNHWAVSLGEFHWLGTEDML